MRDAAEVLRLQPLFAAARSEDLDRLAAAAFPRRLARGQVLFVEGERSDHLHVLVSGRVKVLVASARGEELVLSVLGPGDALGELSVLDGAARSATAVALDDVAMWSLPTEHVRALLRRSPEVRLAVAEELAARVRRLTGSASDLVLLDLPRRLAELLTADRAADGRQVADLSQTEIAARPRGDPAVPRPGAAAPAGTALAEVQRGGIVVLDAPALERFAAS